MKKTGMVCLALSMALAVSCYKDLGNYDYEDIERLEIDFGKRFVNTSIGETLEVKPEYSRDMEKNSGHYTYCWTLDGETRPGWDQKDFSWVVDVIKQDMRLVLNVTDTRNDMVYMQSMKVDVTGIYENSYSWMILYDKGGDSYISFLSVIEAVDEDSEEQPAGSSQMYFKNQRYIADVCNGPVGKGPIALQEHWREGIDWYENVVGNVCVFQESGAADLEGISFTKEIDMKDAFVGGTLPEGGIYPGSFLQAIDVVVGKDGKLYSRLKLSDVVYNSEYFLQKPMTAMGETDPLEKCIVCRGFYSSNRFGLQLVYDGKNKRMLYLQDTGEDWSSIMGAGKIFPVDVDASAPTTGIVPLDNHSGYEVLGLGQCGAGDTYDYGFFELLRKEDDNSLHVQYFVSGKAGWGKPRTISEITKFEVTGLPSLPEHWVFPTYEPTENMFFSVGNKVYRKDLVNVDEPVELYYTFDSNVTALGFGSFYDCHLAVGLEDGSFVVLGVYQAKNIKDEHKLVYEAPEKVGKIVDIQYKNNSMWNY